MKPLRHKYNAKRTECDGIKFASKKEAGYYEELKKKINEGSVVFFLRQVPFHLPGGVIYRLDFLVFLADGSVECVDIKGMETPEFIMKKKLVESLYPIEIKIVKSYGKVQSQVDKGRRKKADDVRVDEAGG